MHKHAWMMCDKMRCDVICVYIVYMLVLIKIFIVHTLFHD